MSGPVLSLDSLSIRFGGLKAVSDFSLEVPEGGITSVIGPNGAGKSTLFNLISGALKPNSGRVRLDGRDVTGQDPRRLLAAGLSRSFQITNLFFELTVRENLLLAAQILEPKGRALLPERRSPEANARADELLESFGLAAKAQELAGHLSHGEQRRLEIAVAMACRPRVLLLDEPTQGMSHADTREASALIADLGRQLTVLLVEHDIGLVMDLSDRVVVMQQGEKLAEGPPAQVRADPKVQAAYLGHS